MTHPSERGISQGNPESPLVVEVGRTFKPFEGLTKLPAPNESTETMMESVWYVARKEMSLGGVSFNIALFVPPPSEVFMPELLPKRFDVPLGVPVVEYALPSGDDRSWKALKTPVQIGTFSVLDSADKYEILRAYQIKLKIGEKYYFMDCLEKDENAQKSVEFSLKQKWGGAVYSNCDEALYTTDGSPTSALLPYDAGKLSQIEATVVLRGQHSSQTS